MPERHSVTIQAPSPAIWPPDDTEESVLGTSLHQTTITNLRLGLNEAAAAMSPHGPAPWQAGSQTIITGFQRQNGSRYRVLPDVFVYRNDFDIRRTSLSVGADGLPLLLIEVASESTYQSDLGLTNGKGFSYAQAGVLEYLVVDVTGEYVPEQGRGWRLEDGIYHPWFPEPSGRWQSREIGAGIALEGALVAVHARDGRRLLREGEIERRLLADDRRRIEELAQKDREHSEELARKDAELALLRRRLDLLTRGE